MYIKFRAFKSIGKTPVYCIALHCGEGVAAGNIRGRHIVDNNIRNRDSFKEAPGALAIYFQGWTYGEAPDA